MSSMSLKRSLHTESGTRGESKSAGLNQGSKINCNMLPSIPAELMIEAVLEVELVGNVKLL